MVKLLLSYFDNTEQKKRIEENKTLVECSGKGKNITCKIVFFFHEP